MPWFTETTVTNSSCQCRLPSVFPLLFSQHDSKVGLVGGVDLFQLGPSYWIYQVFAMRVIDNMM